MEGENPPQPPKKGGAKKGQFFGKRGKKRYSRNLNTGKDKKKSETRRRYNEAIAAGAVPTDQSLAPPRNSNAAARRPHIRELQQSLHSKEEENIGLQLDLASSLRRCNRLENKVKDLSQTVVTARQDIRAAMKQTQQLEKEKITLHDQMSLQEDMMDAEIQAAIDMTKEKAKDVRERHVTTVEKKHVKELNAMHKNYSSKIDLLNKAVEDSCATVNKLLLENKLLKQKHEDEVDALKLSHRESIKALQITHAYKINKKSQQLKAAQELVVGIEAVHKELVDEWAEARKNAKGSIKKAAELKSRADKALFKLKTNKDRVGALTDELLDAQDRVKDLEHKLVEYEEVIDSLNYQFEQQQDEYDDMLHFIDQCYMEEVERLAPKFIAKHYVLNRDGKGKHAEWLPHVDKLILEMLANRTPPSCIQANIYAMAKVLLPSVDVVKSLPSLKHIKDLRTTLWLLTKTLAAYQIGNAKVWKQLHTDGTDRRQTSLVNIVISFLTNDNEFRTICLDGAIIAESGKTADQSRAILQSFTDSAVLLENWRKETAAMFPGREDLVSSIPDPLLLEIRRMMGGMLSHDNCNPARDLGNNLQSIIMELSNNCSNDEAERLVYQGSCHNHLRNTWMDNVELFLAGKLEDHLKKDLELIPQHLRVTCRLSELLIQVDKEYNFSANYPKGHGDFFHDWLRRVCPGRRFLPTIRVCGGSRQDSAFEGALPVYDALDEMLAFTNECLNDGENILQRCLYISLGSMEVIAQLRIASIMFLSVVVPMRWLAGNTHKLGHRDWGERSMGRAIDLLHSAFVKIQDDPKLMLDYDIILGIFAPLYQDLPEFQEYMDYYKEEKEGNVLGSTKAKDRVLAIDEAISELFYPTKKRNRDTTEFCYQLASGVATTLLTELEDTRKATYEYLSATMGKYSQAVITKSEELATVGMRANNDPSEGMFATFTDILCSGGRLNLSSASAIGQVRYNGDMKRGHEKLVTGRHSTKEPNNNCKLGTFHVLPIPLQDSLLSICKKGSKQARTNFAASIAHHREVRAEKLKVAEQLKLVHAEKELINAAYFFQQYHSPRCWKTVDVAREQFGKLTTKKDKLKYVKEQIQIRHRGFGWEEAYHPWSRNKRHFTPEELLDHLIMVVIPLQDSFPIPTKPPIIIPKRAAGELVLGTKSAVLVDLENKLIKKEEQIRTNALNERARLEAEGIGDQVYEMQETSWPLERILAGDFKIDMCFSCTDDEGNQFVYWCQGVISRVLKDRSKKYKNIEVEVVWNDDCVETGENKTTKELLKQTTWNTEVHVNGDWREDLHHLVCKTTGS